MTEFLGRVDLAGLGLHYGVVLVRVLGLFLFVPIFGSELLPVRVRAACAAVLALAFFPLVPRIDLPAGDMGGWVLVVSRELMVGLGLGVSARMIFAGIESAAALIAAQSGFAMANMIDPTSGDQALAPSLFQNLLALALLLAADLHHLFIRAIAGSYELIPPAAALPSLDTLDQFVGHAGTRLFTVAVTLAAPALVITFMVDLVMGLVGRAMPQVPILIVGYPAKLAVGLVAMALLATTTGAAVGWIGRTLATDGAAVLAALAGRQG
jgi:flagellar biosynthetic protein FliR